jgi:hypothetical protein
MTFNLIRVSVVPGLALGPTGMWVVYTASLTRSNWNHHGDNVLALIATGVARRGNGGHIYWWIFLMITVAGSICQG